MKLIKLFIFLFFLVGYRGYGQEEKTASISLSFLEAIEMGSKENISVDILRTEEFATQSDLKDAKNTVYPKLTTSAGYQRYSKVTVYDGFLGDSHQITKPPNPNSGNLGVDAFFNLYNGKKQQNGVKIASYKNELANINTQEHIATISLEIAQQYLDLVRLLHLKRITNEQINRAQKRLDNISSLYKNGKVTKSDLLRAELMLSQVVLDHNEAINDYQIGMEKIKVLINLPDNKVVVLSDTLSLVKVDSLGIKNIMNVSSVPYAIQKNEKLIDISLIRTKLIKADNLPSAALIGSYGFNYPNNLVFPPLDQTYAIGFIGAKISYNISAIYHNKHKVEAANYRFEETKREKEYLTENLEEQKQGLYIKYLEALNRIEVTNKSIDQAASNYKIINTKYFNQLALLTDLLDADDLLQQSKYNYIKANIYTMIIYYKILYITGQL